MALPININQLLNGKTVECDRLEFKKGWNPEEIIHTLCAFANDINNWGGGYVIIGIDEKDGIPILPPKGLPLNSLDAIQKELVNLCNKVEPYVQVISEPVLYQETQILIIWVPGGDLRPYKAPTTLGEKGQKRYFIRHGSVSKIANKIEEDQLFALAAKVPFDDRINHQSEVSDLNLGLIREFLQEINSDLEADAANLPFIELCKQMQIVGGTKEYTKPKNVGLLLFSENPEKYIPCSRIELVHFIDEIGDKFSEKIFTGAIHKQLKSVLSYMQSQVIKEGILKVPNEAKAMRFYNYPYSALEEAITNAVYHKSYDLRNPIEIRINWNSIEILSFEGPMPPIKNIDLKRERVISRQYRNRRIGDFLKELDFTEGRSTGFPKIYRSLKNNGSPEPKFETDESNSYFLTSLPIHPFFITPDEQTRKIMDFCKSPKSSREILDFVGLSYHSRNLKKIIDPLVQNYRLFPTSESANSSTLKYISREGLE